VIEDDELYQEVPLRVVPAGRFAMADPTQRKLGRGDPPDGSSRDAYEEDIRCRIGRSPIAWDVASLLKARDLSVPKEYRLLSDRKVWIVQYSFGLYEDRGLARCLEVGFEVRILGQEYASILELFPGTRFAHLIRANGELNLDVTLAGEGRASAEAPASPLGHAAVKTAFEADVRGEVAGRLRLAVPTVLVSSTGIGDTRAEWMFTRQERPLIGDITVLQSVLIPRTTKELSLEARAYAVIAGVVPFTRPRMTTPWIALTVRV